MGPITDIMPGILYTYTQLGEAVFIKEGAKSADSRSSIRPAEWTPEQLRAMADYMDKNQKCTLMNDGSGNEVKHTIG